LEVPSSKIDIPFNWPRLAGRELDFIRQAIELGRLAGDGQFTERCQAWLKSEIDTKAVLLTHSCTAALEMAAILLDIKPGDEVIMPSFTFVSTANAVVLRGGVPVFVDIRQDTLNLDEELIEAAITDRTKAIFPIHYAGVPAEMNRINEIASRHKLVVVEDAAQALGSTYRGRKAGSLGSLAAFSFHETKNIVSGEGGALAINDVALVDRAEIIREKGTNRKPFFRGQVDKYTWVDIGSSFLPGELNAAFLFGQLQHCADINADRKTSWDTYDRALKTWKGRGLATPHIPDECGHNGHLYYVLMPTANLRQKLISLMASDNIATPFHYVPLHSSPAGTRYGRAVGDLAHTSAISERIVRLPLYPGMGDTTQRVIEAVTRHLGELL
jgi:dTDP-4-amino-4,6-dideoxygalactose transaminase